MNRILTLIAAVALLSATEAKAQVVKPDSLFWVVETNVYNPSYTIVKFYNFHHVLIHEVRLQGVYIDICNPRQKRKLGLLMKEYHDRIVDSSVKPGSKYTLQISKRHLSRRGQL